MADPLLDPKIRAIMAKLNNEELPPEEKPADAPPPKPKDPKPPKSFEEFLKGEKVVSFHTFTWYIFKNGSSLYRNVLL